MGELIDEKERHFMGYLRLYDEETRNLFEGEIYIFLLYVLWKKNVDFFSKKKWHEMQKIKL